MLSARKNRPLLHGHRGARAVKSIPENTLASFDQALRDGCDGFEFDVRLTSDSIAVIGHNPHWKSVEIARASSELLGELPRLEQVSGFDLAEVSSFRRSCPRCSIEFTLRTPRFPSA